MALKVTKEHVWAGTIQDEPGGAARLLSALADAGTNLKFIIARRSPDNPGQGVAFLTPVTGKKAQNAARSAGAGSVDNVPTLRVEGNDKAGLGARMAQAIADAGINVRGISAAVIGNKFVAYLGFDTPQDATKAANAIKAADKAKKPSRARR